VSRNRSNQAMKEKALLAKPSYLPAQARLPMRVGQCGRKSDAIETGEGGVEGVRALVDGSDWTRRTIGVGNSTHHACFENETLTNCKIGAMGAAMREHQHLRLENAA
jgi:hypothetical protein